MQRDRRFIDRQSALSSIHGHVRHVVHHKSSPHNHIYIGYIANTNLCHNIGLSRHAHLWLVQWHSSDMVALVGHQLGHHANLLPDHVVNEQRHFEHFHSKTHHNRRRHNVLLLCWCCYVRHFKLGRLKRLHAHVDNQIERQHKPSQKQVLGVLDAFVGRFQIGSLRTRSRNSSFFILQTWKKLLRFLSIYKRTLMQ